MVDEILVVKEALDNEKQGYQMYLSASTSSKSEIVRSLFKYLAEQELYHIKKIEEFDKFLTSQVKFFYQEMNDNIIHFDEAKQIFGKNVSDWKDEFKSDEDLEVLKAALKFEKEGYDFYKKHHDITDNKKLKDFFQFLCKEEDLHYHFIQNMVGYIESPAQFNMDDEEWFFEG
jgi:rubrerythrin